MRFITLKEGGIEMIFENDTAGASTAPEEEQV